MSAVILFHLDDLLQLVGIGPQGRNGVKVRSAVEHAQVPPFLFLRKCAAQAGPGPLQPGLNGGWLCAEGGCRLADGAALIVVEIDGQAVFGVQSHHGLKQLGLGRVLEHGGIPPLIQGDGVPAPEGAQQLPALVDGHPEQPVLHVLLALKGLPVLQQPEQGGLHHILGVGPVFRA